MEQCVCVVSSASEVVFRDHSGHVVKLNVLLNQSEVLIRNKTFVRTLPLFLSTSLHHKDKTMHWDNLGVLRYVYLLHNAQDIECKYSF